MAAFGELYLFDLKINENKYFYHTLELFSGIVTPHIDKHCFKVTIHIILVYIYTMFIKMPYIHIYLVWSFQKLYFALNTQ